MKVHLAQRQLIISAFQHPFSKGTPPKKMFSFGHCPHCLSKLVQKGRNSPKPEISLRCFLSGTTCISHIVWCMISNSSVLSSSIAHCNATSIICAILITWVMTLPHAPDIEVISFDLQSHLQKGVQPGCCSS